MERVSAYIDGFNLYYGIRSAYRRKYLWLDLERLCASLLLPDQELGFVKYFTARVRTPRDSQIRQNTYLDALDTTGVQVIFGRLQLNKVTCKVCGQVFEKYEEKKTDVAIASHMVADAYEDRYDAALLVGADGDMAPPAQMVSDMSGRRIVVAFPPRRQSRELENIAGAVTFISEYALRRAQLPDRVTSKTPGIVLRRPAEWH